MCDVGRAQPQFDPKLPHIEEAGECMVETVRARSNSAQPWLVSVSHRSRSAQRWQRLATQSPPNVVPTLACMCGTPSKVSPGRPTLVDFFRPRHRMCANIGPSHHDRAMSQLSSNNTRAGETDLASAFRVLLTPLNRARGRHLSGICWATGREPGSNRGKPRLALTDPELPECAPRPRWLLSRPLLATPCGNPASEAKRRPPDDRPMQHNRNRATTRGSPWRTGWAP